MAKQGEATLLLKIKEVGAEVLDRLVITFEDIGRVVGAVTGYISDAIVQFKEQERAVNMLNQSMINAGTYSAELQQEYLAQAAALQKVTLFTDDQINSAQALLQAHVGNRKVTEDLLRATLDLAQAKGMDLASASSLVGKAIAGEAEILKRYGIEIDVAAANGDKLVAVTTAIESKFAGQAEAARQGMGGLDGLKISSDELAEAIGSRLGPAVVKMANALIPVIDKITEWIDGGNLAKQTVDQMNQSLAEMNLKILALLSKRGNPFIDASRVEAEIDYLMQKISETTKLRDQEIANQEAASANATANEKAKNDQKLVELQERQLKKQEMVLAADQLENDMLIAQMENNQLKMLELEGKYLDLKMKNTTDYGEKIRLYKEMQANQDRVREQKQTEFQKKEDEKREKDRADTLNKIATMQTSNNQLLAAAGKAAAITQIAIETPVAISRALSAFPPPFNFAAAGLVGAAMAAQAARVAGVQLAEGGIVMPRSGGVQATIAEAGQPEVVIPLDRAGEFGLGGGSGANITLNVYGGLLGDERTATELAVAIDRKLLELRQNGGSVAFDRID